MDASASVAVRLAAVSKRQTEFLQLHRDLGKTSLFVTHGSDRSLTRLAATPIDPGRLHHPPTVTADDSMELTPSPSASVGGGYAVIVDERGDLLGWLPPNAARPRPVESSVKRDVTLRIVLATLLAHDTGWMAVLDGRSYLGVLTPEALHDTLRRSAEDQA
ncbi:MAG TPA: hypothetical protein VNG13_01490 [Mycobacteriales bacterium]|nr:hypothetical protein [Mycobacteriales bacterium]